MSLTHSPSIATNGLVFYYDISNARKSWRGKPTTNFFTNGHFSNGTGITQEGGSNPANTVISMSNPGETDFVLEQSMGIAQTEYQINLSTQLLPSTTYVMSGWYGESPDYTSADGSRMFHSRAFSTSGAHVALGTGIGNIIETRTINGIVWRYCYATITTPSDYNNDFNWYLGYGGSSYTGKRYYTNIQMEQGTYPSRFVNGTRSNTQAILDLTGNNTITATSLTYPNDGTFSFNGPNYIDASVTPFNMHNLNVWLYNDYVIPGNDSAIGGVVTPYQSPINFNRQTTQGINLGGWTGSATNESVHLWSNSSTNSGFNGMTHIREAIPIGWHNFQFNWNGLTYDIWIDGVKRTTFAANFGHATLHPVNAIRIGGDVAQSYYFVGRIPVVTMYNRQLSDAEVQQNFNALRGRYGI